MTSKYKLTLPKEWVVPFKACMREVSDVNICTTDMGCEPHELILALTSTTLPQLSLDQWVQKAYAVTAAGMFRHRDGELIWDCPDYGGPRPPWPLAKVRRNNLPAVSTVAHAEWVVHGRRRRRGRSEP